MRIDNLPEQTNAERRTDERNAPVADLDKKPYEDPSVVFVEFDFRENLEIPDCPYP